jgi:hypothetical protein
MFKMAHFVGPIIPETESTAVRPTSHFGVQHRHFHVVGGKYARGAIRLLSDTTPILTAPND